MTRLHVFHFALALAPAADLIGQDSLPPSALSTRSGALSPADLGGIRAAFEAARHRVVIDEPRGHRAHNPGQRWRVSFDGRRVEVLPEHGDWRWGLQLERYGFGAEMVEVGDRAATIADGRRLTYRWDSLLDEWYVNDLRGLEHGFTLRQRPAGQRASGLRIELAVVGGLSPAVEHDRRGIAFVDESGHTMLSYTGLKVFDATGSDLPARFDSVGDLLVLSVDEAGAVYPITIDPIAQQAYLKASNTDAGDEFAASVAISGDTVVVGAPAEDSSATGVNGNQADNSAGDSGAAYVFVRSGGAWSQQAYLKASNTEADDRFGSAVAIDGDTIVVAAEDEDSSATGINGNQFSNVGLDAGACYVFVRSGTVWTQQAYLKASNTGNGDRFGRDVAISADTIVVGAVGEDSSATGVNGSQANGAPASGAAYVFERSGTLWTQAAYLKASNTESSDRFGIAVAIDADTVVVGASGEDSVASTVNGNQANNSGSNVGAAYVFVRSVTSWSQQAYLKASNAESSDQFGSAVAVSVDTIVVGAPREEGTWPGVNGNANADSFANSGAAYAFQRTGASWSQQAYLKGLDLDDDDGFGTSVAISGDTIVVGSPGEDGGDTGVNGNPAGSTASLSGAVYVFVRDAGFWHHQAYLKASNTDAGDEFGRVVAISGSDLIVGASSEDSGAVGVNGNEADNGSVDAGAAYVFDGVGGADVAAWGNYGSPTGATGSPFLSGVPSLTLDASPVLGSTVAIELGYSLLSLGVGVIAFSDAPVDVSLGLGFNLLVSPGASLVTVSVSAPLGSSIATLPFPIPNNTMLLGSRFFVQGLVFAPQAPASLQFSATRGLQMTIGL